jgi:hypothetical protein
VARVVSSIEPGEVPPSISNTRPGPRCSIRLPDQPSSSAGTSFPRIASSPRAPRALPPAARAELRHVLMLPDFDRADAIGTLWGHPETRTFDALLIDSEEDKARSTRNVPSGTPFKDPWISCSNMPTGRFMLHRNVGSTRQARPRGNRSNLRSRTACSDSRTPRRSRSSLQPTTNACSAPSAWSRETGSTPRTSPRRPSFEFLSVGIGSVR